MNHACDLDVNAFDFTVTLCRVHRAHAIDWWLFLPPRPLENGDAML